uniref:Galectin n=1 Tax=Cacopsylla melanoneura TaxID=428564 RepID=A0A8D8XSL7_9HEMI
MSLMGKCCPCYHPRSKYETLARQTAEAELSSQFYCCQHTKSTLISNTKTSDSDLQDNQENIVPTNSTTLCDCNNKMDDLDVGEEAIDLEGNVVPSDDTLAMIEDTVNFMNTEKTELCKVWSEQKIRKEWTEQNMTIPFNKTLKDCFETGLSITIQGHVPNYSRSFAVNFIISGHDDDDIALHFNPRFDVNYCVRNSCRDAVWGEEEKAAHLCNPFKLGENFVLEIFCAPKEFMFAVNGTHFCNFTYRYPLYTISRLQILPEVEIFKVQTKLLHQYPATVQEDLVPELKIQQLYQHNALAYEKFHVKKVPPLLFLLSNKLTVGNMIEICGRVKLLPHTFFINLQHGKLLWPHPNISFHTSVRFKYKAESVHKVICNSYKNDVWGTEEIPPVECPYDPGRTFSMRILLKEDHFNVSIDEEKFINYKYRDDYALINTIYISGDVSIQSIQFFVVK